jgi:hypothetical protein
MGLAVDAVANLFFRVEGEKTGLEGDGTIN